MTSSSKQNIDAFIKESKNRVDNQRFVTDTQISPYDHSNSQRVSGTFLKSPVLNIDSSTSLMGLLRQEEEHMYSRREIANSVEYFKYLSPGNSTVRLGGPQTTKARSIALKMRNRNLRKSRPRL